MQITARIEYAGSVSQVVAMLSDPRYCAMKCEKTGATSFESDVTGDDASEVVITTTRNVPAELLPSKVRGFVGSNLQVRDVVTLNSPTASGARTGTMVVTVVGVPCSLKATATLEPTGESSCELNMVGDLVAKIPLVGAKLEQMAAPQVQRILAIEEKLAQEYLAGNL